MSASILDRLLGSSSSRRSVEVVSSRAHGGRFTAAWRMHPHGTHATAHSSDSSAACSSTVFVACSCLSGG